MSVHTDTLKQRPESAEVFKHEVVRFLHFTSLIYTLFTLFTIKGGTVDGAVPLPFPQDFPITLHYELRL